MRTDRVPRHALIGAPTRPDGLAHAPRSTSPARSPTCSTPPASPTREPKRSTSIPPSSAFSRTRKAAHQPPTHRGRQSLRSAKAHRRAEPIRRHVGRCTRCQLVDRRVGPPRLRRGGSYGRTTWAGGGRRRTRTCGARRRRLRRARSRAASAGRATDGVMPPRS